MTTLSEFIHTVYIFVVTRNWRLLRAYFWTIKEIQTQPRMMVTPGKPVDKEA